MRRLVFDRVLLTFVFFRTYAACISVTAIDHEFKAV